MCTAVFSLQYVVAALPGLALARQGCPPGTTAKAADTKRRAESYTLTQDSQRSSPMEEIPERSKIDAQPSAVEDAGEWQQSLAVHFGSGKVAGRTVEASNSGTKECCGFPAKRNQQAK